MTPTLNHADAAAMAADAFQQFRDAGAIAHAYISGAVDYCVEGI